MLKRLKIVTGINLTVFTFVLLLFILIGYVYYSSSQSSRHFKQFLTVSGNVQQLNNALYDMNAALEKFTP